MAVVLHVALYQQTMCTLESRPLIHNHDHPTEEEIFGNPCWDLKPQTLPLFW